MGMMGSGSGSGAVPIYKYLPMWLSSYGKSGAPDQRAAQDWIECENTEAVSGLRAELVSVKDGRGDKRWLDLMVGPNRKAIFGTHEEWARMMLLWMAAYKG